MTTPVLPPAGATAMPQGALIPQGTMIPQGTLRRRDRLQHKRDFDTVFARGRRAQGNHLSAIACLARGPHGQPRLGLAVAKAAGHAPARARLRRLTREAFRALRPELQRSVDLVVSVRHPWPDAQLADVLQELQTLGKKLRLIA